MEQTVEQKLKALWSLQTVHTKIDRIRQVRGELPMEVGDLEDEIAGLETRIEKIRGELDELESRLRQSSKLSFETRPTRWAMPRGRAAWVRMVTFPPSFAPLSGQYSLDVPL